MKKSLKSRIIGSGTENPSEIIRNEKNWREHPKAQMKAMEATLGEVGWVQQVIINKRTGRLIDGHLRVDIATKRGETSIPVIYVDLSEKEEDVVLLTLDPLSTMAKTSGEHLGRLLEKVGKVEDLETLLDELKRKASASKPTRVKEKEFDPTPKPNAVSVLGEVYVLGPHRVVCGDSTDPAAIAKLLGDDVVDIVWTDPPYGVAYSGGPTTHRDAIENDALKADDLLVLLRSSFANAVRHQRAGGAWYVAAPAGPLFHTFGTALLEIGVWRQTIAWIKDSLVMGRSDFHYRHEAVFYGWLPNGPHRAPPTRDQDTVWEVDRPKVSKEHPTMKPPELIERSLVNSSIPGEKVLDLFGGSGSTLIAAAQTDRVARLCELSPNYVDVIRRRWTAWADANGVDAGPGALR